MDGCAPEGEEDFVLTGGCEVVPKSDRSFYLQRLTASQRWHPVRGDFSTALYQDQKVAISNLMTSCF